MTDWDITSAWSTLAVFIIGAWAGRSGQQAPVVAALVMSGIAGAGVNAAAGIGGDYKTGCPCLMPLCLLPLKPTCAAIIDRPSMHGAVCDRLPPAKIM